MNLNERIKSTAELLRVHHEGNDDLKTISIYNSANDLLKVLPSNEKYHNQVLYRLSGHTSEEMNEMIRQAYPSEDQVTLQMIRKDFRDLISSADLMIGTVSINFYDQHWDLRQMAIRGKDPHSYVITFGDDLCFEFNTLLRTFVLLSLLKSKIYPISTATKYRVIKKLLSKVETVYGINRIEDIELSHIKSIIETDTTYTTLKKKKSAIMEFFTALSLVIGFEADQKILNYLTDVDLRRVNAQIENNKTPLLPHDFYETFKNMLFKSFMGSELPDDSSCRQDHFCLGLVAFETQAGLRTSELLLMEKNCITEVNAGGETGYYANYSSTKPVHDPSHPYMDLRLPINKKTTDLLKKLISESEIAFPDSKYLEEGIRAKDISKWIEGYCRKHAAELGLLNRNDLELFGKNILLLNGDIFSCPKTKQFRVYVMTYFRRMGASDDQIREIFGHTAKQMNGYYVRDDHPVQEDLEYSNSILQQVLTEDLTILGPKGSSYKAKMMDIVNGRNVNVQDSLKAIMEDICNNMPIRAKLGGFCLKSNPRRPCYMDADTDELTCAYDMCPNHCFLYFMLPESYQKCKTHVELINHNLSSGYDRYAEKEAFILKNEIEKRLEIEIAETEKEIAAKGRDTVIKQHPKMEQYIDRLESVKGDIEEWKTMIKRLTESKE